MKKALFLLTILTLSSCHLQRDGLDFKRLSSIMTCVILNYRN